MKKPYLPVALILAACLGLTACSQAAAPNAIKLETPEKQVITVTSKESVQVVPDIAKIVFNVNTQAKDAKDCQAKNKESLDKVLEVLKKSGIPEKSIQTSRYGLNPIYNWNDGKTLTGYEMSTTVTVSDLPMDQVGILLTTCVEAGVDSIQSVDYLSSQYDKSYQEALKKAIASARAKAEAIAQAGGFSLGKIVHVEEYGVNQAARYNGYRAESKGGGPGSTLNDMAVMPGQVDVEAQVSVDFQIL